MKLRSWYQVHCRAEDCPTPEAMSACFRPQVAGHRAAFDRSDGQWRNGQFEWEQKPAMLLARISHGRDELVILPATLIAGVGASGFGAVITHS